jgi:hypothetical protein
VFNKAAMMNIGFLEAMRLFPEMNCVMFHDVDHFLEDDRALMRCDENPKHFAVSMDEWNYRPVTSVLRCMHIYSQIISLGFSLSSFCDPAKSLVCMWSVVR